MVLYMLGTTKFFLSLAAGEFNFFCYELTPMHIEHIGNVYKTL